MVAEIAVVGGVSENARNVALHEGDFVGRGFDVEGVVEVE